MIVKKKKKKKKLPAHGELLAGHVPHVTQLVMRDKALA